MERKQRRVLFMTGRYGMKVMRSKFRTSKKISKPGSPPRSHGKKVLRKNTYFDVKGFEYVVIGPALLSGHKGTTRSSQPVPSLLERGGPAIVQSRAGKSRSTRYRARPFVEVTNKLTIPIFVANMEREQI